MRVKDRFPAQGFVKLEIWRRGKLELDEGWNQITPIGRERFPRLLGGDPTVLRPSQMGIGSGDLPATSLTTPFYRPFSTLPVYAGVGVTFQTTFLEEDAVGLAVGELGLADADNMLFAHRARTGGTLIKANDMRLIAFWTIQF